MVFDSALGTMSEGSQTVELAVGESDAFARAAFKEVAVIVVAGAIAASFTTAFVFDPLVVFLMTTAIWLFVLALSLFSLFEHIEELVNQRIDAVHDDVKVVE